MQVDMINPAPVSRNTNRTSSIEDNKNAHVTAVDKVIPETAEEMAMHDLVIRGATVVDGLGNDPIRTDLAVRGGRISRLYRGRRRPPHRRGSPPS